MAAMQPVALETIEPAQVQLRSALAQAPSTGTANAAAVVTPRGQPWFALVMLAVLAVVIVVVVHQPASAPAAPVGATRALPESSGTVALPSGGLAGLSAAQRADRRQLRHIAEDALDELIHARAALTPWHVRLWNPMQYRFAEQEASRGENAFRDSDYQAAAAHYRNAGRAFRALVEAGQALRQRALVATHQALLAGDVGTAQHAIAVAAAVAPGADVTALRARVKALPGVLAATLRGETALGVGDNEGARAAFNAALALDPLYEPARAALRGISARNAQNQYLNVMSQGYDALQRRNFSAAQAAFVRAQAMHPERGDAQVGLTGLAGDRVASTLEDAQAKGARLTSEERYAEAAQIYEQALHVDPSLAFAKRGLAFARERQQALQETNNALAHPERLSSDEVLAAARALRERVARLPEPSPLLRTRLTVLDALLARATTPVKFTLISDGLTQVRVFRVGTLGKFAQKQLELRPGRYTVIGNRDGFRDIRRSFDVAPDMPPVTVRCEERI